MKKLTIIILMALINYPSFSQNAEDYYYEIPDYPASYSGANAIARMIDGLGFRFYWATVGLREVDLKYKPSEDARTSQETLQHIYQMSKFLLSTLKPNEKRAEEGELTFAEMRAATLKNYEDASKALQKENVNLDELQINIGGGRTLPFWNHINGPISDALWHVGQVVSFRRASGNPFTSKVSVFTGKVRE